MTHIRSRAGGCSKSLPQGQWRCKQCVIDRAIVAKHQAAFDAAPAKREARALRDAMHAAVKRAEAAVDRARTSAEQDAPRAQQQQLADAADEAGRAAHVAVNAAPDRSPSPLSAPLCTDLAIPPFPPSGLSKKTPAQKASYDITLLQQKTEWLDACVGLALAHRGGLLRRCAHIDRRR